MPEPTEQYHEAVVEEVAHEQPNVLKPEVTMMVLTWATFLILLAILYKFAWKPILATLDQREESLRKSIDEADAIKRQLEEINAAKDQIIQEAHQKAQETIEHSRKAATELAKVIEKKARDEGQIVLQNALREINAEKEKARFELRKESANLAVQLASRIMKENLDNEKSRKITDEVIKNI